MERQKLQIANPCSESFDEMEGEGHRRFCDHCDKHVHNLSDLTREEARKLLRENADDGLCVVYLFDSNDRVQFRDDLSRRRPSNAQLTGLKKLLAAAALVPMLAGLPGCDTAVEEPAVIERPCDLETEETFRPIDEIRKAEERFLDELRDFLGFLPGNEPEVEVLMGEPAIQPPPIVEPEPEPQIMGEIAPPELEPAPESEPVPQPDVDPEPVEPTSRTDVDPDPMQPPREPEPRMLMGELM